MTRSHGDISLMAATASVLQIAESFIPLPLPGIKFGFANLITLVALVLYGFRAGLAVALLRALISSLLLGSFLSPGFVLSVSGAVSSALIMGAVLCIDSEQKVLGLVGISVLGALAHNFAQLFVVSTLFTGLRSVVWFVPWILLSGALTGYLTGSAAIRLLRRLKRHSARHPSPIIVSPGEKRGSAGVAAASMKLIIFFAAAVFIMSTKSLLSYVPLLALIGGLAVYVRIPADKILKNMKRLLFVLLFSFIVNAFPAWHWGIPGWENLRLGCIVCLRLITLTAAALLVMETTSGHEIAGALQLMMKPLRAFGLDPARIAGYIASALETAPAYAAHVRRRLSRISPARKRSFKYMSAFALSALTSALRDNNQGAFAYARSKV